MVLVVLRCLLLVTTWYFLFLLILSRNLASTILCCATLRTHYQNYVLKILMGNLMPFFQSMQFQFPRPCHGAPYNTYNTRWSFTIFNKSLIQLGVSLYYFTSVCLQECSPMTKRLASSGLAAPHAKAIKNSTLWELYP